MRGARLLSSDVRRERESVRADPRLCRRPGASVGPAGRADGLAPSCLHRAAAARQPGRARRLPGLSGRARACRACSKCWSSPGWSRPILIAYFLSRTGQYESAHVLSSLSLTGLVTAVAVGTGGIGSFAAIWLVVVPLEAALSASRRVVALASTFALGAAGFLLLMGGARSAAAGHRGRERAGCAGGARHHLGGALRDRARARRRVAGAHQLLAALRRGRPLSPARPQHDRRHHPPRPRRRGAVRLAGGRAAVRRRGAGSARARPVRPRPCRRPSGLSHGARRCGRARRRPVGRVPRAARRRRRSAGDRRAVHLDRDALPSARRAGESDSGHDREVVAVMRDVTERKTQEQALEDARAEAERANAAKSRFLATMSHELRTPLNAIIGFSEMLTKEDSLLIGPERRHEYAQLINNSGHHLLSVVNGILDMSKIETGDFEITPEPFAPARDRRCLRSAAAPRRARPASISWRGCRNGCRRSSPTSARSSRSCSTSSPTRSSSPIAAARSRSAPRRRSRSPVRPWRSRSRTPASASAPTILPRIGDPFFQARSSYDRRHDGTGLGLSIVKGLLALHGGDIDIVSRLGEGTRVTFRLPLDCASARSADAPSAIEPSTIEQLLPRGVDAGTANVLVKKSA